MIMVPIKRQSLKMIAAGEKREEYCDLSPYYRKLLGKWLGVPVWVRFRNGYRDDSPTLDATVVPRISCGRPEWGAEPDKEYFVLAIQRLH